MPDLEQINQMPVLYTLPGMEEIPVRRDKVYKTVGGEDLTLDVYYPLDLLPDTTRGAVLFVHGGSQPEDVEHITQSRQYRSWSQLIAASGLIAVMFKHRTDEGYSNLPEAANDVDDLIAYIRSQSETLHINPDALAIWTASSGPPAGLRTTLRDTPPYIRGIVAYYGVMSLLNRTHFTYSEEEEPLLREFSPAYHLSRQDPAKIAPLFVVKAGLDRAFLNESIDEVVSIASRRNIPITFMNHPTGEHGFDIFNNNVRTCAIIKATVAFLHEHLQR